MDDLKEKCDWVPLTPAKSVPQFNSTVTKISNHDLGSVKNPKIWGKLGKGSGNSNFEFGNSGSVYSKRVDEVEVQCSGSMPKSKGINGGISDNDNSRYEFGLGSKRASTLPNNPTPRKRRNVNYGVDSNKTPRKRVRMKRHRPKVFDETKPKKPSTPKPRTPKRPSRPLKKKVSLKTSVDISKDAIKEAIDELIKPSCRQKLNFDLENGISNVCDEMKDKAEVDPKLQFSSGSRFSALRVYKRIFRPNECLKNSRKLGPNCPKMFKKTRMRRKRATLFEKFIFTKISNECLKKSNISVSQRPKRAANKHLSSNFTMKLRRRKKRARLFSRRRKSLSSSVSRKKEARTSQKCILNLNWMVHLRRKRSKASTRRRDLSSLAIDLSIIEVSKAFLLKASRIKSKVPEDDKFAAFVEMQDKGIQNLATKDSIGQQEFTEVQNVLEIDHEVVKDQNVLQKSMKEMGSFTDKLLSDNKCQFRDRKSEIFQCVERQEEAKVKCTEKTLESDSMKPYLAGPHHEQKDALSRQYDDAFTEALINFACKRMECLNIDDKFNQLVVRDIIGQNALVPSKGKFDLSKPRKPQAKVDLDSETIRVWNLLMENSGSENTEHEQEDIDKAKYWEEQREIFRGRVDSFIARMHLIQGDRRFSPWKGSVVDSVVGVFLTQNVSDHLSSSAFMSLAARFPPPSVSEHCGCDGTSDSVIHENDTQNVQVEIPESPPGKCEESETIENYPSSSPDNRAALELENGNKTPSQTESTSGRKKGNFKDKQENTINWDDLRKRYSRGRPRNRMTVDTVNWEAVRQARLKELAEVIVERGMNNILAGRIKDFLNRIVRDHGNIDLEWLRDVPPDKAKEYLLSIPGLGLKSVECVRLLTLHHHAFPVDVNVGRILVRLGWVPLQPLPEDVQIHLLNQYPMLDTIQKYIWPRLCVRDQPTLYEAHYQMITFGKAFCTKRQPNCNACPMRGECRHFASAYASARLRLGGPRGQNMKPESSPVASGLDPTTHTSPPFLLSNSSGDSSEVVHNSRNCEPIIEIPPSPEPEPESIEMQEMDIEDYRYEPTSQETQERDIDGYNYESDAEIPTIRLNDEEFKKNVMDFVEENGLLREEGDMSKMLVTLRPELASIPMPKLKYVGRLKTVHQVYELPDSHPLLTRQFEKREPDDPCPYLLAIWATTDETTDSSEESLKVCENDDTVQGTILIPCRTANRGSFPLNGTYFQVNEVFADQESSRNPIAVPREWIWNLKRRVLYCGTSVTSISRGLSMEGIAYCFRNGFICVRGFDTVIRAARPLARRFHLCKTRQVENK
ncbi:hypothetical protein BUALT_Bualt02G0031400 [Buddleja alternifolia]|uniref:HhH-GPD domain-containing protein n=1 Tax=Buddleja alternifolia TaxID=168488 RepID=A0AAV6Y3H6_9LAMI|nr:hypothetical protein BUALT_Bualt02G0031400 [Buddleja alternifolia]